MTTFYQLTATRLDGQPVAMLDFAGKVVLVVNTASNVASRHNTAALRRFIRNTPLRGWWCLGSPATSSVNRSPAMPTTSPGPVTFITV